MAVRLQMKLGVVADADRLPASPDTLVAVEPQIGSIGRSKGSLYLLVTGKGGHRQREATRLVAETIQSEYYYDESAGIVVCLEKVIRSANKRLNHAKDRVSVGRAPETNGPIGVAVAVVRGSELYVATVGPAEAYLVRGARLLTLPDPHRERGLPTSDLQVDVWRGEIAVGDSLVLTSPNITAKVGLDELKDSLVTLHPQSAIEHLHNRFVAESGAGSDGLMAIEATEVASTSKHWDLVPVWPSEPLAGAPERSPIPLADSVSGSVAAVQASARGARSAAGGALFRAAQGALDLMPRRGPRYRRVTPMSSRRETQRRAAIGMLALVIVATALGVAVWLFGGRTPTGKIDAVAAGQQALDVARADIATVFGNGNDLVTGDRPRALTLLTDAYHQLDTAAASGVLPGTIGPLRAQVIRGLDRLYGLVPVAERVVFSFGTTPANLRSLVQGPDGAPYVLDAQSKSVYRIDVQARKATVVLKSGNVAAGTKIGDPRLLAVGGPDLLILDSKDHLWRWRPADTKGRGTLTMVRVKEASSWGSDIRAVGTYLRSLNEGLYNLYVVDPSSRQILRYSPAADGSGFPAASSGYLATAQDVSDVDSMYIDGDVFVTERGIVKRFSGGQLGGWTQGDPGDELLRPTAHYVTLASYSDRGTGQLYAYDQANARVVALDKASGDYREQYRLAGGSPDWKDLRGMYVVPVPDGDPVVYWIDQGRLMTSPLTAVPDSGASPAASGSLSPSPSATVRPSPSSSGRRTASPKPSR